MLAKLMPAASDMAVRNSEVATIEWNGQSSFASAVETADVPLSPRLLERNRRMESRERPLTIRARIALLIYGTGTGTGTVPYS